MSAKSAATDAAEAVAKKAKKTAATAAEAVGSTAKAVVEAVADKVATGGSVRSADVQHHTTGRGFRKTREGLVVSDKMDKTVVVAVEDRVKHPLYGKVVRRTSKLKAHDEQNACGIGDRVMLMETRPLSATKRWRVAQILEKAQ